MLPLRSPDAIVEASALTAISLMRLSFSGEARIGGRRDGDEVKKTTRCTRAVTGRDSQLLTHRRKTIFSTTEPTDDFDRSVLESDSEYVVRDVGDVAGSLQR